MITSIKTVIFQRNKHENNEVGLMIGVDDEENGIIIDDKGKPVNSVWNYKDYYGVELHDIKIGS